MTGAAVIAVGCSAAQLTLPPAVCLTAGAVTAMIAVPLLLPIRPLRRLWPRGRPRTAFLAVVTAVFLFTGTAYRLVTVVPCERLDGVSDTVTGTVTDEPLTGRYYTVRITRAGHLPAGRSVLLYCPKQTAPAVGDTVTAAVTWRRLTDTQSVCRADGIFLRAVPTGYGENAISRVSRTGELPLRDQLRGALAGAANACLNAEQSGVVRAICLGDKSGLTDDLRVAFRNSGLPHLLVVSGLHLTVIATAVFVMTRRLRLGGWLSRPVTALTVIGYMWLIGPTPSVIRAGVMCLVLLCGELAPRHSDSLNSLGLVLTVLLLASPYALLDLGMILSFAATGGLLIFMPRLRRFGQRCRHPLWRGVCRSLAVNASASLPLIPVLSVYYGTLSVVSPLANLLAVSAAQWLLITAGLAMLVGLVPPLAVVRDGLFTVAGRLSDWLCAVARWCGDRAFSTVSLPVLWMTVCLTGTCVGLVAAIRRRSGKLAVTVAVLAAGMLTAGLTAGGMARTAVTCVTVLPTDGQATLLVETGSCRTVIATEANALSVLTLSDRDDGRDWELLTVGDGDTAAASAVTDSLCGRTARRIVTVPGAAWPLGLGLGEEILPPGGTVTFADGYGRLTRLVGDGWYLQIGESTLFIGSGAAACLTDPTGASPGMMPGYPGAAVFTGMLPTGDFACGQAILVCPRDRAEAFRAQATPGQPLLLLTDRECRLTTRGNGEWSLTGI